MNPADLPGRMARRVRIEGDCWLWVGAVQSKGYGSTTNGKGGSALAHRRAYEAIVGPIPVGMTLDHLCRVKTCVNPAHLEPVTLSENVRRASEVQTHCKHGHQLAGDNLAVKAIDGSTRRVCIACRRTQGRRSYDRNYKPASGQRRALRSVYREGRAA